MLIHVRMTLGVNRNGSSEEGTRGRVRVKTEKPQNFLSDEDELENKDSGYESVESRR